MSLPTADQLFTPLQEYLVILCRKCQHAIRPSGIVEHLRHSSHKIPASHARQVEETVKAWGGCVEDPQFLELPKSVRRPIEGLAVHTDGLLCTITTDCGYVCRSRESLRRHWREGHGWSTAARGRIPQQDIPIIPQSTEEAMQRVVCQRFFIAGAGSHYMYVDSCPVPSCQRSPPHPSPSPPGLSNSSSS
jgi:hypothetical protein